MSSIASGKMLLQTRSSGVPSRPISSNLRRALGGLAARRLRQTLEVTKRLQGDDLEAKRASQPAHVLRPPVEIGQIVLEDLDPLVAGLGRGTGTQTVAMARFLITS
jgi:hypothetical protein